MVAVESHASWPGHTSWEAGNTEVQPAIVAIVIDFAAVPSLDKIKAILASIESTAPVFKLVVSSKKMNQVQIEAILAAGASAFRQKSLIAECMKLTHMQIQMNRIHPSWDVSTFSEKTKWAPATVRPAGQFATIQQINVALQNLSTTLIAQIQSIENEVIAPEDWKLAELEKVTFETIVYAIREALQPTGISKKTAEDIGVLQKNILECLESEVRLPPAHPAALPRVGPAHLSSLPFLDQSTSCTIDDDDDIDVILDSGSFNDFFDGNCSSTPLETLSNSLPISRAISCVSSKTESLGSWDDKIVHPAEDLYAPPPKSWIYSILTPVLPPRSRTVSGSSRNPKATRNPKAVTARRITPCSDSGATQQLHSSPSKSISKSNTGNRSCVALPKLKMAEVDKPVVYPPPHVIEMDWLLDVDDSSEEAPATKKRKMGSSFFDGDGDIEKLLLNLECSYGDGVLKDESCANLDRYRGFVECNDNWLNSVLFETF